MVGGRRARGDRERALPDYLGKNSALEGSDRGGYLVKAGQNLKIGEIELSASRKKRPSSFS